MLFKRLFFLFSISGLVSLLFVFQLRAETWRLTSLDWQPYSGSDMANQGSSVNKLRELLKKEGIELVVDFYPWKRAQRYAKTTEYIGYFPAWPEEVKEGFIGSPPIDWSYIGLMTSGLDITWESIDNLFKNYSVGIVGSYVYPPSIEDAMKKYPHNVIKTSDEKSLVKMLSKKRFDAALTDPNVMQYNAKKYVINNIKVQKHDIEKKALVISFKRNDDNKSRIELLKKILKEKY